MRLSQVVLGNIKFNYRIDDKYIGQRIALDKYEKYETAMVVAQAQDCSVVVDVGANIGYYTLLLAKRVKKVYAFEPDKENFEILKKNVEENSLKNVVLVNKAVGSKNEKVGIKRNRNNYGDSKVLEGNEIECIRLDDFMNEKVDLIKIDVQGFEPRVIEGAKEIIKKDKPILFVESEKNIKLVGYETWSINDFAETPWPIWKGFQIKNNHGYADLWMKNKFTFSDYWTMLKNVNYKKWIKGIMT